MAVIPVARMVALKNVKDGYFSRQAQQFINDQYHGRWFVGQTPWARKVGAFHAEFTTTVETGMSTPKTGSYADDYFAGRVEHEVVFFNGYGNVSGKFLQDYTGCVSWEDVIAVAKTEDDADFKGLPERIKQDLLLQGREIISWAHVSQVEHLEYLYSPANNKDFLTGHLFYSTDIMRECLCRSDGHPYLFKDQASAQMWIDNAMRLDAIAKFETPEKRVKKLASLNDYGARVAKTKHRVSASAAQTEIKQLVLAALDNERAEVHQRTNSILAMG
ncbi:hypothetical protein LPB67_15430 [Undibacterium sp. Jales W-56]|uniref:hypothetical protein n=1 Tax=Undibacterium sp. Jales W-56 TaxID=2897325 RepID=UPI0021D3345A|nr:hypothetical protein [Undibacterium sp. Jales W-56]MCU6435168.1 hypothetical protein [Undibacterium sp. Jales W-56]